MVLRGSVEDALVAAAATVGKLNSIDSAGVSVGIDVPINLKFRKGDNNGVGDGNAQQCQQSGLLLMRGGRVIIASVKEQQLESVGRAVRQVFSTLQVGSGQASTIAAPLVIALGCTEGSLHPGYKKSI